MSNLLGAIIVSDAAYKAIIGLKIASFILLGLCALTIIIVILIQPNAESRGTNALTGASETYYAQNKGSTREGILKRLTIACAIIIFIVSIFLIILLKIQAGP